MDGQPLKTTKREEFRSALVGGVVYKQAAENKIAERTLKRAKNVLGVKSFEEKDTWFVAGSVLIWKILTLYQLHHLSYHSFTHIMSRNVITALSIES